MGQQRWVELFNRPGLPAALGPDMPLWLRCHAPLCVAFESVSVAACGAGAARPAPRPSRSHTGVHESFALIEGLG
jgi:2-dehydropantoate 2-reductase